MSGQQALGQQGLFEKVPPRHVVMPQLVAEQPCWWGVDTGTSRYNIGWCTTAPGPFEEGWQSGGVWRGAHSVKLGGTSENVGERLHRWQTQARTLVRAMLEAGIPPPGVVLVEQATGPQINPPMMYAVAIATASIFEVARQEWQYVPRIEFVQSNHWKAVACGHGGIKKPKFGQGVKFEDVRETYRVLQWARLQGYHGVARDCWDDADCMAMAECARLDVAIRC